ncbi:hypothetical protein QN096_12660 [Metapseudomonas otitidis]|uniref:hypothetical protein n=1 Tax=Metapseudomonas otitidis TaxID=319939 RepID=UPI002541B731|nr:hypothetical protein [Pseudomonas otitidis]WIF69948.1 hypothetical protein QN096_12660 [Pseudomonas otitidis]
MFEVTGADIANLSDGDLRTLVARLALSELRAQGCPVSSVTAGGNQDAADGGLDVRVECPIDLIKPDFVPRAFTGFQVKKPDMPASAIRDEMRPRGALRPVISELAKVAGAYIIVSAQGSVADKPLADRRAAIRQQVQDLPGKDLLYTDFYDRDRLANWVNEYPGIAAWVRSRVGFPIDGWSSIGDWGGTQVVGDGTYLIDEKACITDERSTKSESLTIGQGIKVLRDLLQTPGQCIRLIGLSGLGKTRLVQALFENGVGEAPLDPCLAVYTDYSCEPNPTARDMARYLVKIAQRAILIVDNCNPETHSVLAQICSDLRSNVSLLTVEYDVGDDEPESTEVFRLQSASPELVSQWLEKAAPGISKVDRRTIADFSDGNFRVARAIANTLGKGETLGKLKSRDLFERIFHQRNAPDQNLLRAAEELSLFYSVDGEDCSDSGELALIGCIRKVGVQTLYEALGTLRQRGIAQSRGRWRAILPHAIANPLATHALERIPATDFDRYCSSLTQRMRKSLSRRVGYLHDSPAARAVVARWLCHDGPLGDLLLQSEYGFEIITNIAPVDPEAVLAMIEREINKVSGRIFLDSKTPNRWQWVRLIKMLGYDAPMFGRAAILLARFVVAENGERAHYSAEGAFAEFFHLYLSGTQAQSHQRQEIVRQLAGSPDPAYRRCASIALKALLKSQSFSSTSSFEFGARSRDWGWTPKFMREEADWYKSAIELAVELSPILGEARSILGGAVRGLWRYGACHGALESAVISFTKESPWVEGWLSFRAALQFGGNDMPNDFRARLEAIIQQLQPTDLLHRARAVVISGSAGGWDLADLESDDDNIKPWQKAAEMAIEIGAFLAQDHETRREFLPELFLVQKQGRTFECGRGLAQGTDSLVGMWQELLVIFSTSDSRKRSDRALGGFIYQANKLDAALVRSMLDEAIGDPDLVRLLPYLQAHVGVDKDGVERLQRGIDQGGLQAIDFLSIANGVVGETPAEELRSLLLSIAKLSQGINVALNILQMHFYSREHDGLPQIQLLIELGRDLLCQVDLSEWAVLEDYSMHLLIRACCSGSAGEDSARSVCAKIYASLESYRISFHDVSYVLKALFSAQPQIALDIFLLSVGSRDLLWFDALFGFDVEVEIDPYILNRWADIDATVRYPLLGKAIPVFKCKLGDDVGILSPLFVKMLEFAPDKQAYLGGEWERLYPRGWSRSLSDILFERRKKLLVLAESKHEEVRKWLDEALKVLDLWIEQERFRDRAQEERFE